MTDTQMLAYRTAVGLADAQYCGHEWREAGEWGCLYPSRVTWALVRARRVEEEMSESFGVDYLARLLLRGVMVISHSSPAPDPTQVPRRKRRKLPSGD